ncbi:MAG TPA: hypothetical protein VFI47_05705 [Acidimicrobiales bacterium]|nr:hypothetical protein [Acidimicrobiales bacterium]
MTLPPARAVRARAVPVAVVAAVLAAAPAACGGGQASRGYADDLRDDFVAACAAGASTDVCRCLYDALEENVPFERFEEIDRQIREDPTAIPPDVVELAAGCGARHPDAGG